MGRKPAPLDLPVAYLRGVGAKKAEAFEKAGVHTLRDLFYYTPRRYLDRTGTIPIGSLSGATPDEVTIVGRITDARLVRGRGGKSRYEALLEDGTGGLRLVWFRRTNQIMRWIIPGFAAAFSGKVTQFDRVLQMAHPDVTSLAKGEIEDLKAGKGRWVALYPGGEDFDKVGLDTRGLRRLMDRLIGEFLPGVTDIWPDNYLKKLNIWPLERALAGVHRPHDATEHDRGWERIKFDELFMLQLLWAWTRRSRNEQRRGIAYPKVGETTREMIGRLPFELTEAQRRVLREIWGDMALPQPMSRLLQGDVGSGKTVVALVAMTIAVENGFQAALMVPTEILAEQHYLTSRRFLEALGVEVELLTGGANTKARKEKLARLAEGKPGIVIGTHALIQETVSMPKLGIVVIDEQHRFGVAQRLRLMEPRLEEGGGDARIHPDVIVMTATPIPRSLTLTLYGDLDVSRLDEMPPGRGVIETKAVNGEKERKALYREIRRRVEAGGRAYVVFPLVSESEKLDLQAAVEGREELAAGALKGIEVGLIHGRMKLAVKEEAMRRFADGSTPVLVATTVIEVGIDVPEATEMVIEHAERFGLAQLHQLRGRVGRGGRDSKCYLVAYPPVGETARSRIGAMVASTDGFLIAEEDLRIRGAGDIFGIRQHGMPELRFSDIVADHQLLIRARKVAEEVIEDDPELEGLPLLAGEFRRTALKRVTWLDVG